MDAALGEMAEGLARSASIPQWQSCASPLSSIRNDRREGREGQEVREGLGWETWRVALRRIWGMFGDGELLLRWIPHRMARQIRRDHHHQSASFRVWLRGVNAPCSRKSA